MRHWSLLFVYTALISACSAAPPSVPTVAPAAETPLPSSPIAASTPTTVSPAVQPTPSPGATKPAAIPSLPTVETSRASGSAAFLTPVELELEFAEPLTSADELRTVVDGVQTLNGIARVTSDGVHLSVRYDSGTVLPARIRDRLRELGHPARAGTEIQSPGDTAD